MTGPQVEPVPEATQVQEPSEARWLFVVGESGVVAGMKPASGPLTRVQGCGTNMSGPSGLATLRASSNVPESDLSTKETSTVILVLERQVGRGRNCTTQDG